MTKRPFAIIPVIDLKGGVAVRARAGERDSYAPLQTPLSPSADPAAVARGLLDAVPARTLYVADLDAIEAREANDAALSRIARNGPGVELWVDGGFGDEASARAFLAKGVGRPVLGSESQRDAAAVRALGDEAVLSLDYRGDDFIGPRSLLEDPDGWPGAVIVMTLARVGTSAGPDFDRLAPVVARAGNRRIYAAGGVRGPEDLASLAERGVAGVLVASAIHDGRLRREHLSGFGEGF
jgi:phosphoribosylformimino-5-aminoimidazole carboxamide ribotide isomerase